MDDSGSQWRRGGVRLLFALPFFVAGAYFLKTASSAPEALLSSFPFIFAGGIILAPFICELAAAPFLSLFHPSERFDRPQPMYSVPAARRAAGDYEGALRGYEEIARSYPGELRPHIEMLDIAVVNLKDEERARFLFHRSMAELKDAKQKATLRQMYESIRTRLQPTPEWLRAEQARTIGAADLKVQGPVDEPDGLTRRRFHVGGNVRNWDSEDRAFPGDRSPWLGGFEKVVFPVGDRMATVVLPHDALPGKPWAWKGEFLDAFPGTELALLGRGFHIVYLHYPDQFGHPRVVAAWDDLYARLTTGHGMAARPALIGLSRGGLYCYAWAAEHPERVACIYGDAPVCDLCSWPGGRGCGVGSPAEWARLKEVFGFRSDEEALAYRGSPVDRLEPLAAAGVPILHVYGEADEVVPWPENTGLLAERYRRLGGSIELIGKPGCGHHPHGLEDPSPVVDFVVRHAADAPGRVVPATPVPGGRVGD